MISPSKPLVNAPRAFAGEKKAIKGDPMILSKLNTITSIPPTNAKI